MSVAYSQLKYLFRLCPEVSLSLFCMAGDQVSIQVGIIVNLHMGTNLTNSQRYESRDGLCSLSGISDGAGLVAKS